MPSGIRRKKALKGGISDKVRRRAKKEKQKQYILDNPLIAEHWDPKLTVSQNYHKLGLSAHTQRQTGGTEDDKFNTEIKKQKTSTKTAQIIKNPDGTTKIVQIEDENDDLDAPIGTHEAKTDVAKKLEELASKSTPSVRHLSTEEAKWLHRLVEKHGDDYTAMQWDRKLNTFQHSAGELRRRIRKLQQPAKN